MHPAVGVEEVDFIKEGLALGYVIPTQHEEVLGCFRLVALLKVGIVDSLDPVEEG